VQAFLTRLSSAVTASAPSLASGAPPRGARAS
jgi:hypothetical protein